MENTTNSLISITPIKGKDDKSVAILLSGDLSLNNVDKVKTSLAQVIDNYQTFTVKVQNIDNVDLGLVQIIQSFVWSANQLGKNVKIRFDFNDDQTTLFKHAGLSEFISRID